MQAALQILSEELRVVQPGQTRPKVQEREQQEKPEKLANQPFGKALSPRTDSRSGRRGGGRVDMYADSAVACCVASC